MAVTAAQLRQEIFALGGRHMGDPLNGAIIELKDEALSYERRRLLDAVVAHLKANRQPETHTPMPAMSPTLLLSLLYLTIIAASCVWTVMSVRSLLG
jgi:hypothetical protein